MLDNLLRLAGRDDVIYFINYVKLYKFKFFDDKILPKLLNIFDFTSLHLDLPWSLEALLLIYEKDRSYTNLMNICKKDYIPDKVMEYLYNNSGCSYNTRMCITCNINIQPHQLVKYFDLFDWDYLPRYRLLYKHSDERDKHKLLNKIPEIHILGLISRILEKPKTGLYRRYKANIEVYINSCELYSDEFIKTCNFFLHL